jgi:hypothetical protein
VTGKDRDPGRQQPLEPFPDAGRLTLRGHMR